MQAQTNYNLKHSRERCFIERAFGLLKGKWRKLKYLDVTNLQFLPFIILSACVLHNYIIDTEEKTKTFKAVMMKMMVLKII